MNNNKKLNVNENASIKGARKKREEDDILSHVKTERRLLSHVPDPDKVRSNSERRGDNFEIKGKKVGQRYLAEFVVILKIVDESGRRRKLYAMCRDISKTGMLLSFQCDSDAQCVHNAKHVRLKFKIPQGAMEEGMESKISISARSVRLMTDGIARCGMEFDEPLYKYLRKKKDVYALSMAGVFMFVLALCVLLMRAESVLYFKFNKLLYFYSIVTAVFLLSRYAFGAAYRPVPINPDFTPGVTIIIPCFNEEKWIARTIYNCVNQDYPVDKLEVIIVDDCSNDNSVFQVKKALRQLYGEAERFKTKERVKLITQAHNAGKREALAKGALHAKHELVVFVDSDSFLEPDAIRNLVQPFQDPKMGGVSGRTDVANAYTNSLTKLQTVRYYVAFRIMKAAEAYFDSVSCLSGPLSCYRKDLVMKNLDAWLNQKFMGQRATFGDDRSLTNYILRHNRTYYQDTAVCSTIVPNQHKMFLKQQMRWKRSWLRESMIAGTFIWKKEPLMALFFYMGLITPLLAPVIVIYNLIYVPIVHAVFPTTFIIGILLMSMMMSFAQLFFRRSSIWIYGLWFCLYYEMVLLWQMPIAWVTFWKSTWGTRLTPEDLKAMEAKERRKAERDHAAQTYGNADKSSVTVDEVSRSAEKERKTETEARL